MTDTIPVLGVDLQPEDPPIEFLGKVVETFESRNRRFQVFKITDGDSTVFVTLALQFQFGGAVVMWAKQLWPTEPEPPTGFEDIVGQWVTVKASCIRVLLPTGFGQRPHYVVYTWARASAPSYLSDRSKLF